MKTVTEWCQRHFALLLVAAILLCCAGLALFFVRSGIAYRPVFPKYSEEETEATPLRAEILDRYGGRHAHTCYFELTEGRKKRLVVWEVNTPEGSGLETTLVFDEEHRLVNALPALRYAEVMSMWALPGVNGREELTTETLTPFLAQYVLHADEFEVTDCVPWAEGLVTPYPAYGEYHGELNPYPDEPTADWLVTLTRRAGQPDEETVWLSVGQYSEDDGLEPGWYVTRLAAQYGGN